MKEFKMKNLNIKFSDELTETQITEAIKHGFVGIDPDAETVYIIKVNVGNLSVEHALPALKALQKDFLKHGIKNCIFVPLSEQGIRDIEVIEVPNERV